MLICLDRLAWDNDHALNLSFFKNLDLALHLREQEKISD